VQTPIVHNRIESRERNTLQHRAPLRTPALAARRSVASTSNAAIDAGRGRPVDGATIGGMLEHRINRALQSRVKNEIESRSPGTPADRALMTSVERRLRVWTDRRDTGSPRPTARAGGRTFAIDAAKAPVHLQLRSLQAARAATTAVRPSLRSRVQGDEPAHDPRPFWGATSYTHAAARMVQAPPDAERSQARAAAERTAAHAAAPRPQPAPPPLNIERLSEEVYRQIQRKIRIERERRGL
jgi:hypothetical protein